MVLKRLSTYAVCFMGSQSTWARWRFFFLLSVFVHIVHDSRLWPGQCQIALCEYIIFRNGYGFVCFFVPCDRQNIYTESPYAQKKTKAIVRLQIDKSIRRENAEKMYIYIYHTNSMLYPTHIPKSQPASQPETGAIWACTIAQPGQPLGDTRFLQNYSYLHTINKNTLRTR